MRRPEYVLVCNGRCLKGQIDNLLMFDLVSHSLIKGRGCISVVPVAQCFVERFQFRSRRSGRSCHVQIP